MKRLFGVLTLAAVIAVNFGCQGRSPGSPKSTKSVEADAKAKLTRFNQTDINSYPAGSSAYSKSEADTNINFLKSYIKDGEDVLRVAGQGKMKLDNKETVEANIQTAKALLKSYEGQSAELDKGDKSYGYL